MATTTWNGVYTPARISQPLVRLLRETLLKVFQDPAVWQKIDGVGIEWLWEEGDAVTVRIESDLARWRKVVQAAHITAH